MTISFDHIDWPEQNSFDSPQDFQDPLSMEIAHQSSNNSTLASFSEVLGELFSGSTIFKEMPNAVNREFEPMNATFCDSNIDFPSDISSIDDLDYDSGSAKASLKRSDIELEISALDVMSFFAENSDIPVTIPKAAQNSSIPLDFSTDKRLGQDEDKATNSKTKIDTTAKNPSLTPAFKAAIQGQNRLVFEELAPRRAKEAARSKITSCIKRKK